MMSLEQEKMRQTGNEPMGIHLSSELTNRNKGYGGCGSWSILNALSAFKMKIIIRMISEPKHKNFKGQNKIKQRAQIFF